MSEQKKWSSTAGPRQHKAAVAAINELLRERYTRIEKRGVIGVSETSYAVSCFTIGGTDDKPRQDVLQEYELLGTKHNGVITADNYQQIVADAAAALARCKQNRPVNDQRVTPEQDAAQVAERAQRDKEREAAEAARLTPFARLFSKEGEPINIPSGYIGVTLGLKYDNSDIMTDYFEPHATLGFDLLLAIVPKQAETERLARNIVARYPELAKLQWTWKKDSHGNYLTSPGFELPDGANCGRVKQGKPVSHAHWEVEFSRAWRGANLVRPWRDYPGTNGAGTAPSQDTSTAGTSARVVLNNALNGVEIHFDAKPSYDIIGRIKAHGFRWAIRTKCWYKRQSPGAIAFAHEIAGVKSATHSDPAGSYVQAQEDAYLDTQAAAIGA